MNAVQQTNLIETRYRLTEDERDAAASVLARTGQLFAQFNGTLREAYDAMTMQTPIADGVALESVENADVSGWWVRPESARGGRAILFLHGGAFVLGSAMGYRGLASQIAVRTGIDTFVLDYPLAPEHPFPAAYDAASDALRWMVKSGLRDIALVGDSAGAGLALAVLAADAGRPMNVACVAAFSPWVDLALTGPSTRSEETRDRVLTRPILADAAAAYLGSACATDRRASPLYELPEHLPPIALQVGTDELLLDDARRYALAAAQRGNTVQLEIYEGLHHVFQRCTRELASARRALDRIAEFIVRCGPGVA
jgi:monoterpene epsilon-lactone hydrolase